MVFRAVLIVLQLYNTYLDDYSKMQKTVTNDVLKNHL